MSYSKTIIEGNLGRDAECRIVAEGVNVISFAVAVTDKWKDKEGKDQEHTDWYDCDLFCKTDGLLKVLTKGARVLVDGRMTSRDYEKDSQKRRAWSMRVDKLDIVGFKDKDAQPQQSAAERRIMENENVQALADKFGAQNSGLPF